MHSAAEGEARQDALYEQAIAAGHGPALARLARAYEADPERRRELLQEVHIELWRSFAGFDGRCSLRTWLYRVAHNVAASHVLRSRRTNVHLVSLDELEDMPAESDAEAAADQRIAVKRLLRQIELLNPIDRQVIVLYLEGMDRPPSVTSRDCPADMWPPRFIASSAFLP